MNVQKLLDALREEMLTEVREQILPYWSTRVISEAQEGFVACIGDDGRVVEDAPKGGILGARILWTFSAASRVLADEHYGELAARTFDYLKNRFWDADYGGMYWSVDAFGTPVDDRKHVYAQAFAIYACAEFARAAGSESARQRAVMLFHLLEEHACDPIHGGYREAFDREWRLLDDGRLSDKDADEAKSMNTHLHVLEAYTNLLRVWEDPLLRERLHALVRLFLDVIIDVQAGHLRLFFEADWTCRSSAHSYGHDVEASWLLLEAVDVLGDATLRAEVRTSALRLARAVLQEGVDDDGGIFNERDGDHTLDDDKHWWPQAEAVVGFLNAYQETGDRAFAEAAADVWAFIGRCIVDRDGGEWRWSVARDGTPYTCHHRVGPWKGPYHNSRACFEVAARVHKLQKETTAGPT